ncbi:hypothetical protein DL93DRAFT_1385282 [Clavulina sp. PMI_390]|nr:hypothetical protein DL93DRAFT_1385282 [Clavulina sp. PMI_390]
MYSARSRVSLIWTTCASPQWTTEPVNVALNLYHIRNVAQGTYLSIANAPDHREPILCTGKKHIWEIRPNWYGESVEGNQVVRIYSRFTDYVIDLIPETPTGSFLVLHPTWTPDHQKWAVGQAI